MISNAQLRDYFQRKPHLTGKQKQAIRLHVKELNQPTSMEYWRVRLVWALQDRRDGIPTGLCLPLKK